MSVEKYTYLRRPTCRRLVWISFSRFLTFLIPDFLLYYVGGLTSSESRQAWREKIALFFLFLFSAAFFCFWLEYISSYFCDPEKPLAYHEVFSNDSKMAAINGKAVDWRHTGIASPMIDWVNQYPHHDLSANFPKFIKLSRSSDQDQYRDSILNDCVYYQSNADKADAWLDYILQHDPGYSYSRTELDHLSQCPLPDHLNVTGGPCFYGADYEAQISALPVKGDIEYDPDVIRRTYNALPSPDNSTKQAYVILDGYVLDVTTYLSGATTIIPLSSTLSSRSFALDRMFLPLDLTLFLYINLGKDITDGFDGNVTENPTLYRNCLIHLFQKGVVPSYISSDCSRINPALWATMGVGLLYFLVKMNLAYLSRVSFIHRFLFNFAPEFSSASFLYQQRSSAAQHVQWPHTILMVPCFSESSETLKQTLDTLSRSTYDDNKKLLLFVCDGVTTSTQEQKETYVLLLEYLGYSCTDEPLSQAYTSLGQHGKRINYARVYSGYYETGRNRVPYLVIVKIGQTQEETEYRQSHMLTAPPGNRGKRDSLVLVFGFLERCMNLANNRITPLDYEIFNQCYNVLGIDPRCFKYMLVTDADIQVQSDIVQKLVSRLEQDRKMLAVSGHVRPANPEENLTTMLQIFPAYMTFFSGLAYEACLRSVMTINGGLVMYKIWTENVPFLQQQEQSQKFLRKWKLPQKHQHQSNNTSQQSLGNHHRRQQLYNKWPKLSDEIIITDPFQDPPSRQSSLTNESTTTMTTATTTATASHRAHTRSISIGRPNRLSMAVRPESRLSLSARVDVRPCCVHPTVLRGISTPYADTMHMQNVLLLGEEKIMPIVLLKSHPNHRLGFEPEAVGYATLPTNFFSLQGLQIRNIRSAFHTQLEMQRVSWQLGLTYWILSTTELLDMIFSMPIIVYLYGIFGRSVRQSGMAYVIIACSFTGLVALHILFFLLRRQFRYILWFVLYCLLSLPLYAIWFPILAVWQSDYAAYWYDVWPTTARRGARLHGIIDRQRQTEPLYIYNGKIKSSEKAPQSALYDDHYESPDESREHHKGDPELFSVPRLRLGEHEVVEATRLHQAAEAALDSNFIGFTGFADGLEGDDHLHGNGAKVNEIATPPLAQLRDVVHSTRITANNGPPTGLEMSTWRHRYPNSKSEDVPDPPAQNPFADIDNPFDDEHGVYPALPGEHSDEVTPARDRFNQHRPSHSQSSYFTYTSQQNDASNGNINYSTKLGVQYDMTDGSTLPSSINSSGFAKIPTYLDSQQHADEILMSTIRPENPILIVDDHSPRASNADNSNDDEQQDRASILSISSNTFSIYNAYNAYNAEIPFQQEHFGMPVGSNDRLPRHRIALYNNENLDTDDDQGLSTAYSKEGPEEGRSRAVHNFSLQQPQQQTASYANLRQQYDNHAALRNASPPANTTTLLKSKRLKKVAAATSGSGSILHIPSSGSLSRHFRNMSDSTSPSFLKNQASKSTLITGEVDIRTAISSEVRSYLQRVSLESTTRVQVKSHLIQHFGVQWIDESDTQLMDFVNQCVENVTNELLNSVDMR
ncbi:chitin synthase-domain-containing protein [Parasitella parasitica]|nr:chitin synthase-domain-containing protein [Parasitella parasitica]